MPEVMKEKKEEKKEEKRVRINDLHFDSEEIKFRKLDVSDHEDVIYVFYKKQMELDNEDKKQIKDILLFNLSYGCFASGMLVGLILVWPDKLENEEIYSLFEPIIIFPYDKEKVFKTLIEYVEKEAKKNNVFKLSINVSNENKKIINILNLLNFELYSKTENDQTMVKSLQ